MSLHDCPKPVVPFGSGNRRHVCPSCEAVWEYVEGVYGDIVVSGRLWNRKAQWVPKPEGRWVCLARPERRRTAVAATA